MFSPAVELRRDATLADLFERDFARWLAESACGSVPVRMEAHWRASVLDPALEFLGRSGKQFRARLVHSAWTLAGGGAEGPPLSLPLLVEVLHAGSLIVDDVQDSAPTRRGRPALHHMIGEPLAINTGNLLYAWALDLAGRMPLDAHALLDVYRRTSATMLRCHHGQALDLSANVADLPRHAVEPLVRSFSQLKAGELMSYAASLGALAARGGPTCLAALASFGSEFGVALQRLDDLSALVRPDRREKAVEDLRNARATWAWVWLARVVDDDVFAEFQSRVRSVAAGADSTPLISSLAARILGPARIDVRESLRAALSRLGERIGPCTALSELEAETERLEASYVP